TSRPATSACATATPDRAPRRAFTCPACWTGGLRLAVPASQPAPTGPLASASPTSSMRICATLLGDRRRLDYRPWPSTYSPAVIDSLLNFVSLSPFRSRQFRSPPQLSSKQSQSDATNSAVAVVAGAAAAAGAATADPAASSSLHPGHLAQFEDCNEAAKLVLQDCISRSSSSSHFHWLNSQPCAPLNCHRMRSLNWPAAHGWLGFGPIIKKASDPGSKDSLWGKALQGNYWVTGPMTWQEFHQCRSECCLSTDGVARCAAFGPLKDRESCQRELGMTGPVSLFAPPYVLHASSDETGAITSGGELNYRRLINLRVPDCHRRRKASTRQLGPERLLEWICDLPETRAQRWRLVLSRLGRLGHGELLVWADLLKTGQPAAARRPLGPLCAQSTPIPICASCPTSSVGKVRNAVRPASAPTGVSAAQSRTSLCCQLRPVFSQANPADFLGGSLGEPDLMNELLGDPGVLGGDTGNDLSRLLGRRAATGSGQLMQQPLALGYYLSSAPPGPVPAWFRVAPPEQAAVCLRASLHLNQLASCDRAPLSAACDRSPTHPLNTYKTTEVLRYVLLETCHSLSWLSVDPATGDRVSCLPRHINQLFLLLPFCARHV
uniref:Mediator of RNA polymerase II transcription subunit 13 n=1 Tax=Macrostomum lignano TaxID=282301 RepID=A0A1I8FDK0_9PLAT